MSIFLLFQACESVRVFTSFLGLYCLCLIWTLKTPNQPRQLFHVFIKLDTCNGGLVINKLNELTSYNHTNAGVLQFHCPVIAGHFQTQCHLRVFFLSVSLGKIKVSQCLFQLYTIVLVKKFFLKCGLTIVLSNTACSHLCLCCSSRML